jgi:predicted transcriptional regulator of viral defense system
MIISVRIGLLIRCLRWSSVVPEDGFNVRPPQATIYGETQGRKLLRRLANAGRFIFSTAHARAAAAEAGVPGGYVNVLLSELAQGGWILRLRKGLYALTGSPSGSLQIHPFAIATRLVEPSAISHWSALSHHGFTEQVPNVISAFTPAKVVTPSMRAPCQKPRSVHHAWEIGGVRYQYATVKKEHFFGVEETWVNELFKVPITDKERTVLETFITPRTFGGIGEALALIEERLNELDLNRLVRYTVRYGRASVAKRLGWALEMAGASLSVLAPLETFPASGVRILDPTRPRRGPSNRRWGIQENLARSDR